MSRVFPKQEAFWQVFCEVHDNLYHPMPGKGIDPEYKDADMDYEVTRSDIKILKQIHSLGDAQYKRLMAYMKALQKLEQMENMVEE